MMSQEFTFKHTFSQHSVIPRSALTVDAAAMNDCRVASLQLFLAAATSSTQ